MTTRPALRRAKAVAATALLLLATGLDGSVSAGLPTRTGPATTAAVVYRLPLAGRTIVLRGFDPPAHRWSAGHRGVDLAASGGSAVLAPAAGVVTFAGPVAGRPVLSVRHADGRVSSLEPVQATVPAGTVVGAGTRVGTLVTTGSHCAPATCLYWGVRLDGRYVDPMALLPGTGPVVLLPRPG